MVLHQFQLSYLRQQRYYTNKRKSDVVLLQLEVTKKSFFLTYFWSGLKPKLAPIVWWSCWTENNCAALKWWRFWLRGLWLWSCWHGTSQRSREHSAFEDERQRRRTWIAWEGGRRQELFMILKQQWMGEWIISGKVKEDAEGVTNSHDMVFVFKIDI